MSAHKIIDGRPVLDLGALRTPITIRAEAVASPPEFNAGGTITTWTDMFTARAAVEGIRGRDVIAAGQATTQQFWTVTIWFQDGVLPNMRIVLPSGSELVIQSVENVLQMNIVHVLNCVGLATNV